MIRWNPRICPNLRNTRHLNELTHLLQAVERGDTEAGEQLLPATYDALRRIAANKMAQERAGHTLQPTALVHEAYLRLLDPNGEQRNWNSAGHFFSAAAEAMCRILIEHARRKQSIKRGGDRVRTTLDEANLAFEIPSDEVLAVDEALRKLQAEDPEENIPRTICTKVW